MPPDDKNRNSHRVIGIRASLLASFCLLIAILAAVNLVLIVTTGEKNATALSRAYLDKASDQVHEQLDKFFDPLITNLELFRQWTALGLFDPRNINTASQYLIPLMQSYPHITSIATGTESGYSYRIGVDNDGYLVRVVESGEGSRNTKFIYLDRNGETLREAEEAGDYEVRQRPWYKQAMEKFQQSRMEQGKMAISVTPPFILHTSREPGISIAIPVTRPDGERHILDFNVMLKRISTYTTGLSPSPEGFALVMWEDGSVLGFPKGANRDRSVSGIYQLHQLGMPVLDLARQQWLLEERQANRVIRFDDRDMKYHAIFNYYALPGDIPLWIGVFVPEKDFLHVLWQQRNLSLLFSVIALLFSIIIAIYLSRLYERPLKLLSDDSDNITRLEFSPLPTIKSHIREVQKLATAHHRMRVALDAFSRYVPRDIVRLLMEKNEVARLGGTETTITILFTDIRGFTSISEQLSPTELTQHLSRYFEGMMEAIRGNGGAIDKMIGDAIMAMWGAPRENSNHSHSAIKGCLECMEFLKEFNSTCTNKGLPPLKTGFGLASGNVMVGNFGYPKRINYTSFGDTVNLASRLEGATKFYGVDILCSESVQQSSTADYCWRLVDEIAVKGKTRAVKVYELLGTKADTPAETIGFARLYEAAFVAYQQRDFTMACKKLNDIPRPYSEELSVKRLFELADKYRHNPPEADWNGIQKLASK